MYRQFRLDDCEMSDVSDFPCDSDVAGPGATLNNDSMNVDVDSLHTCDSDVAGRSTTLNYDYLNIDVDVSNPSCMCESIADHDGATLMLMFPLVMKVYDIFLHHQFRQVIQLPLH
jgi:hypothetical protein